MGTYLRKGIRDLPRPPGAPGEVRLLKAGFGFLQPDIWIVDAVREPRVWKTWGRKIWIERKTFGCWLARREGHIIGRLQDLPGFPAFLSHPDPWTVEMTLMDAEPVPEEKGAQSLPPLYFDRLWDELQAMHARGINHGDLRRKNLLRSPTNPAEPRMVDFTQCLNFQPPVHGIRAAIFSRAVRIDRLTFLKLKQWYLGEEALTAEERAERADVPWCLKAGQFLRKRIYRPLRRRARGDGHRSRRRSGGG